MNIRGLGWMCRTPKNFVAGKIVDERRAYARVTLACSAAVMPSERGHQGFRFRVSGDGFDALAPTRYARGPRGRYPQLPPDAEKTE